MNIDGTLQQDADSLNFSALADSVLNGHEIDKETALKILKTPDCFLVDLLKAAKKIRSHYHSNRVKIHVLKNAKSNACPEDCSFCSQSTKFNTEIETYKMQTDAEIIEGARKAHAAGATTYCIVTATRGPSKRDLDQLCSVVKKIKDEMPIKVCASLGLLNEQKAQRLADAGVDRYNHNLETSKNHFPNIVSTHEYSARENTIKFAKENGMEACSGGIVGLGEGLEDRIDLAFSLRKLSVESVPINFLNPRPGTPLGDKPKISPEDCLRTLAMFRFVHPSQDIRIAGGREICLKNMQSLGLYAANSIFADGYLTTGGQGLDNDLKMIKDAGFEPQVLDS